MSRTSQQGAVIFTVSLMLFFLLGFVGIALDIGRLYVVRGELQTAMDACALAAAQELDGASSALDRATSAGITAGNLNRVNLQSVDWDGKGQVAAADISFRDASWLPTTTPAQARYAVCRHTQPAVRLWLLQAFNAFGGNSGFPRTQDVAAHAVATLGPAQSTCPVPLALHPNPPPHPPGTEPWGFSNGQWITLLMSPGSTTNMNGQIGWANLDGSTNAAETVAELKGHCGTRVGDTLGTPGVQTAVADEWNARFGIYKNSGDPATTHPDYTGYAYTSLNWPAHANAYSGTPGASTTATLTSDNFLAKRASFASCDDQGTTLSGKKAQSCESITGLSLNSFTTVALPGSSAVGGFHTYGSNRRIVTVPVVDGSMKVTGYACMLMLQPLSIPMTDVQLEFIGDAATAGSPCNASGLPGGATGPLVPVLVQ